MVEVIEITPETLLKEQQGAAPPLVLDCREAEEWAMGHIPGSLHIPMMQIPFQLSRLDRNMKFVVVCAHGHRSFEVAAHLLKYGFHARSLQGGLEAWYANGGQIVHGTST